LTRYKKDCDKLTTLLLEQRGNESLPVAVMEVDLESQRRRKQQAASRDRPNFWYISSA